MSHYNFRVFRKDHGTHPKKKQTTRGSNFGCNGHFHKNSISSITAPKKMLDFDRAIFVPLIPKFSKIIPDPTSYVSLGQQQQKH